MMPLRGGLAPLTLASKTASGNGLLNNLVAYWGLDEAAGANNALDKHSGGLTMTQAGSPGSGTGIVYAGARSFNGSTQSFNRASSATIQTGDVDWTVAAWVWFAATPSAITVRGIVAKDAASKREFFLNYDGNSKRFKFTVLNGAASGVGDCFATTFGEITIQTWYLVIGSHDATASKTYISVNAGAVDSIDLTGTAGVNTAAMTIGRYYDDGQSIRQWDGRIGPVMFWKSTAGNGGVLTAAQRTALYAAGAGLAYSAFTL